MKSYIVLNSFSQVSDKRFAVNFNIIDDDNELLVDTYISRESVIDFVIESEMNIISILVAEYMEYEQMPVNASNWIDDNQEEAIISFLEAEFKAERLAA